MKVPLIFDIKRSSLDDGGGIRTVIFFKGCPLNCVWCHNPESVDPEAEYFFDASRCIKCGGSHENCFTGAFKRVGRIYEIDELLSIIAEDVTFYKVSGGGVTFSGGEPTLYMDFLGLLARKLTKTGISCALETCGYFDYSSFMRQVLPYLDCVLYDIKLINSAEHIRYTGKDNEIILENLRLLSRERIKLIPRTPLIPDITDTPENLKGISGFLEDIELCSKWIKLDYSGKGDKKREMLKAGADFYQDRRHPV